MLLTKPLRFDPRVHHEARALQEAGHDVRVVEWARQNPEDPPEETVEGVPVVRVHNEGLLGRIPTDHLRNPVWWRRAAQVAATLWPDGPDVVHCHDLDTLPAGTRLKRRLGTALVFDAHEVFSHMITGHQPGVVVWAADRLERMLLPRVDRIVTASDGLAARYRRSFGGPITTVLNSFAPPPREWHPPSAGRFTATYIGTLSKDRLFPDLVHLFGRMGGVDLVIGGKREGLFDTLQESAEAYPNVAFLGPVPHREVHRITSEGHLVVCMLDPTNPQYRNEFANKLFDALSCGRPIVVSEGTRLGDFVRDQGIGLAVPYEAEAVRAAVLRLRDDPDAVRLLGHRAFELARETYNWDEQARRLLEAYQGLDLLGRKREKGTR